MLYPRKPLHHSCNNNYTTVVTVEQQIHNSCTTVVTVAQQLHNSCNSCNSYTTVVTVATKINLREYTLEFNSFISILK